MRILRRAVLAFAGLLGIYLVFRAALEPFVVGGPGEYANAWGGPSLAGVLAVHMLPGVVSLVALAVWAVRVRRRRWHSR